MLDWLLIGAAAAPQGCFVAIDGAYDLAPRGAALRTGTLHRCRGGRGGARVDARARPRPRDGAAGLGKASAVAPNVDRAFAAPVPNVHGLQTSTTNRFSFAAPAFQIYVPVRQRTGTIQVPGGGEIGYSRFVAQILLKKSG